MHAHSRLNTSLVCLDFGTRLIFQAAHRTYHMPSVQLIVLPFKTSCTVLATLQTESVSQHSSVGLADEVGDIWCRHGRAMALRFQPF